MWTVWAVQGVYIHALYGQAAFFMLCFNVFILQQRFYVYSRQVKSTLIKYGIYLNLLTG